MQRSTHRVGSVFAAMLLSSLAASAQARPVSYQGGWTFIGESDRQTSSALVHYTPDPRWSVGARTEWDRKDDILFNGVQATWLAKRWFGEDMQANLYVTGAVGVADGVDTNPGDAGLGLQTGVMADWETRRWFLGYRARAHDYAGLDAGFIQAGRAGFAPYIGDTGDLHTWFMVEVDNRPDADNPVDVTPLLRFFKGSALLELGYAIEDDEPLINFQYRF